MGVKELWSILAPFCESKPLYELQGKTVAVDLACWICEAMTVVEYSTQPRFYLRNLYFRTCFLLLLGVNIVYVLDGKAPELKYNTISQRTAVKFRGSRRNQKTTVTGKDRTRFNSILKQCETLLDCMGIKCVHGAGEAEATCAYLNKTGMVDGCISQDSDCFVYGAEVVYRNFSVSHRSSAGSIDVYELRNVRNSIDLGRNKMVALALICGCDYNNDGVNGVGRDMALKFIDRFKDDEILDRLRRWTTDRKYFEELELKTNDPLTCTSCGHSGKVQKHTKSGCVECGYAKGCNPEPYRNERALIKNELGIRKRALLDGDFPDERLIEEYLEQKNEHVVLDTIWKQPDMVKFVMFTKKMLEWDEVYSFKKFLCLLTRWQLVNYEIIRSRPDSLKGILVPEFIRKRRTLKNIVSYEIVWKDPENHFFDLIPSYQIKEIEENPNDDISKTLWSTVEPKTLVDSAYPELVATFEESKLRKKVRPAKPREKKAPRKQKTAKKKSDVAADDGERLDVSFGRMSISPKRNRQATRKRRSDTQLKPYANVRKIDDFFPTIGDSDERERTENKRNDRSAVGFNESSVSSFENETDLDLSSVVDDIINRKLHVSLRLDCDCNDGVDGANVRHECSDGGEDVSFFFDRTCKEDGFERILNDTLNVSDDSAEETSERLSDEFDTLSGMKYVPLIERIKRTL